ncbi:MAG: membrane protein [Methylibium sp. NZG]|nr:MAG: membrane protein [Methylibium sp. NZG]
MFDKFKIGQRLGLGFGIVLLLLVLITGLAIQSITSAIADEKRIVELQHRATMADEWVASTQLNVNRVMGLAKSGNNPEVDAYFKPLIAQTTERINELQKSLEAAVDSDQGKALLVEIAAQRKEYVATRKTYFDALKAADPQAGSLLTDKLLPTAQRYVSTMQELKKSERALVNEVVLRAEASASRQIVLIAGMAGLALVVGVLVAWRITRSVTAPVNDAVRAARAVADGDLTQPVTVNRHDELGELQKALAAMKDSLLSTVRQVRQASDSIGVASSEIASGNQDLSARTEQAASNLEETAASMEELTSTVRNSADAARQANQLAASASEVAVRGGQVVSQVVSTMQDIHQSSQKINDIIGTIDGIAFQTNILALNAAVEAARAGEQGRGFAVVAGEVRNLAQRSAEAAKEIKGLIGASVEKVEAGTKLVADAGQTMSEIVGSIQRVSDIVGEITAAAGEQSDGIGQVNTAVNQLDQMTQQNAALVEESAAAAESLKDQASRLTQVVAVFRIDANASGHAAVSALMAPKPAPLRHSPAKALGSTGQKAHKPATTHAPRPTTSRTAAPVAPAATAPAASRNIPVPASAEGDWESF